MLFTTVELILLILIVTIILIIFILLTLNEIRDYRVSKRKYLITDDDKDEVVNKKIVRKEPIVLNGIEDKVKIKTNEKENIILDEEEVVLPKPVKSSIIIEEEEEYYDPFFDEEDIDLTQKIDKVDIKDELHINDVINEKDIKEDIVKVQDVIELENKKVKDHIDNYEDTITSFEMEQEENAIISLDELSKVSDRLYGENEPVQYDDTDAPITIDEIMKKFNDIKEVKEEPIVITTKDVVKEDDLDTFVEEEEEDFLTDLSRTHRRMNRS